MNILSRNLAAAAIGASTFLAGCNPEAQAVKPGQVVTDHLEEGRESTRKLNLDNSKLKVETPSLTIEEKKLTGLTDAEYQELVDLESRSNLLTSKEEADLEFYSSEQSRRELTEDEAKKLGELKNGNKLTPEQQLTLAVINEGISLNPQERKESDKNNGKNKLTPTEKTRLYELSKRVAENLFNKELESSPDHVSTAMLRQLDSFKTTMLSKDIKLNIGTQYKPGTRLIHSRYNFLLGQHLQESRAKKAAEREAELKMKFEKLQVESMRKF